MKTSLTIIFTICALLGAVLTASAIHEMVPAETQPTLPGPDAIKVFEYIVHDQYASWNLWPGRARLYNGTEPHGSFLTVYVNNDAYYAVKGKKAMQDGAIIVLEGYSPDKKLTGISVMYKINGYNREGGDWFWAKYSPSGKVESSGRVKACIDCHGRNGDYLHFK